LRPLCRIKSAFYLPQGGASTLEFKRRRYICRTAVYSAHFVQKNIKKAYRVGDCRKRQGNAGIAPSPAAQPGRVG
jgi:hypothetical protein